MRRFQRAAVAAVGLLAFSGFAAQSAQASDPPRTYGSFSSCQSAGKSASDIVKYHCVQQDNGSWYLEVDQWKECPPPAKVSTASTKNGLSTMGC
ncbi:hypothetical protein [Streptomyces sp. ODS28]|uniref:hypothetical protein n=1 Tax=Streptomyces sp. ODS28 TaxID=3136688 RepID=UPI0031E8EF2F